MAKSKYFQKKKEETLPEGNLTVEEALAITVSVDQIKDNDPLSVASQEKDVSISKAPDVVSVIRKAYDVFFDRSDMSYKIVTIHYDHDNHSRIVKSEVQTLDKNQAKAASTIQKVFAMKFLKRT